MFVILQAPNNGYYWLIKAVSKKHFELLKSGFSEIDDGEYKDMLEKINYLEWARHTDFGRIMHFTLKRIGLFSYTYVTEDELQRLSDIDPEFFDKYEIVDNHDWFGKY